jgi:hypothetical protein
LFIGVLRLDLLSTLLWWRCSDLLILLVFLIYLAGLLLWRRCSNFTIRLLVLNLPRALLGRRLGFVVFSSFLLRLTALLFCRYNLGVGLLISALLRLAFPLDWRAFGLLR